VGKENTNAAEVMDVLFGAKRVGAGEFGDFARYIPGLIAGGKAIGVGFKDTAGLFAYMTGKGMSAERSATLLENAYTAFGKSDITSGLETEGISVFNLDGSMKQMDVIFAQLQNKLAGFGSNDEAKSGFLEKIGLKDTQAKQAFMVLASDSAKLKESMDTTRNATWELNKALEFARNPSDNLKENWAKIQLMLIDGGRAVTEILSPALEILSPVLSGVAWLTGKISDYFSTWVQAIKDGNPFILGLTGSIAAYTIMLNQATIAKKLTSFWDGILSLKTKLLTGETWALNTALLANPFVWIPVAIGAVVAAIIYAWKHFEGFRKVIMGVWEVMKQFGKVLYEAVIGRLIDLVKGIGQVGIALWKLMKGDFKGAWESTKEGFANMSGINSAGRALEEGKKLGAAWEKGKQLGAESWAKSQEQKTESDTVPGSSGFLGAGAVGGKGGVLGPDNAPVGPTGGEASSGGTKNITITIGKVGVDSVTLAVQNVREGVGEIREMLQSELIRVVNSIALS
jgi:TP901 family phage tail tape measure protein